MYTIVLVSPGNPVEVTTYPTALAAYRAFGRMGVDKWSTEAHILSLETKKVEQIKYYIDGEEDIIVLIDNPVAAMV